VEEKLFMEIRALLLPWTSVGRHQRLHRLMEILYFSFFLIGVVWGGVHLSAFGTEPTNRPIVHAPGDCDVGEIGE
jgi:hypothetical protein